MSRRRLVAAGLAVLAAVLLYATGVLPRLPDPKKLIIDIADALGPWTYALVGLLAFLETGAFVGLVAPGETVVIAGGVIAGQGQISLVPLIGVVWTCAVLGDTASFFIGRRLGRRFILRHGHRVKITSERLERVEGYFERHGGKTILIGRFIGLVRALAPFVAGSSGFAYRRFIPYSIVGTGLWAGLFCTLGYVFWQSFDRVAGLAGQALLGFAIVVGVIAAGVVGVRRLRDPEQRRRLGGWLDRRERLPIVGRALAASRALARRSAGPLKRLLAPELLELTTALAIAGVGAYACALNAFAVARKPGPTLLDSRAAELADKLYSGAVVDVVKVITDLGSLPTVAILLVVTAAVLASNGRRAEPLALVAGLLVVYAGVQLLKAGFDRPRPPDPLVQTLGAAFPSGHAAYSTAWVASAVALWSWLGLAGRASLVLGATAVCAVVGLSRVYLDAHWLSDVVGGWGLGFAVFGLMATIALIVTHIRHNGGPWTSTSASSRSRSR